MRRHESTESLAQSGLLGFCDAGDLPSAVHERWDLYFGVNAALRTIHLLEAFRKQLDAQRGKNVSESAYLALDLAAEQLIVIL